MATGPLLESTLGKLPPCFPVGRNWLDADPFVHQCVLFIYNVRISDTVKVLILNKIFHISEFSVCNSYNFSKALQTNCA